MRSYALRSALRYRRDGEYISDSTTLACIPAPRYELPSGLQGGFQCAEIQRRKLNIKLGKPGWIIESACLYPVLNRPEGTAS
jgi:hypothetical protein